MPGYPNCCLCSPCDVWGFSDNFSTDKSGWVDNAVGAPKTFARDSSSQRMRVTALGAQPVVTCFGSDFADRVLRRCTDAFPPQTGDIYMAISAKVWPPDKFPAYDTPPTFQLVNQTGIGFGNQHFHINFCAVGAVFMTVGWNPSTGSTPPTLNNPQIFARWGEILLDEFSDDRLGAGGVSPGDEIKFTLTHDASSHAADRYDLRFYHNGTLFRTETNKSLLFSGRLYHGLIFRREREEDADSYWGEWDDYNFNLSDTIP